MTTKTPTDIFNALDAILDAERSALLSGELEKITDLLAEKTRLVEDLNALQDPRNPSLNQLRDKVERNQLLLNGALDGIRQVADRLAELRKLRHSFDTYDSQGHRQTIEGWVNHKVEKRA